MPRYSRYMRYYRRGGLLSNRTAGIALAVVLAAGVAGTTTASTIHHHHHHGQPAAASATVAHAISYERAQLGKPYCWGGTGSYCYDCSGLVMRAYRLPWSLRTSEEQWAGLPHVPGSQRRAGDLVFAPGSDGTLASPGHVGLLIGRNTVIQAYGTGTPIEVSTLTAFIVGAGGLTGYARP